MATKKPKREKLSPDAILAKNPDAWKAEGNAWLLSYHPGYRWMTGVASSIANKAGESGWFQCRVRSYGPDSLVVCHGRVPGVGSVLGTEVRQLFRVGMAPMKRHDHDALKRTYLSKVDLPSASWPDAPEAIELPELELGEKKLLRLAARTPEEFLRLERPELFTAPPARKAEVARKRPAELAGEEKIPAALSSMTDSERARLLDELMMAAEMMVQGSFSETYRTCGKAGCKCMSGEKHGPHLYCTFKTLEGRSSSLYVPRREEHHMRAAVDGWGRFWDVATKLADDNRKRIRLARKQAQGRR